MNLVYSSEDEARDKSALDLPVVLTKRSNKKLAQGDRKRVLFVNKNFEGRSHLNNYARSSLKTRFFFQE